MKHLEYLRKPRKTTCKSCLTHQSCSQEERIGNMWWPIGWKVPASFQHVYYFVAPPPRLAVEKGQVGAHVCDAETRLSIVLFIEFHCFQWLHLVLHWLLIWFHCLSRLHYFSRFVFVDQSVKLFRSQLARRERDNWSAVSNPTFN